MAKRESYDRAALDAGNAQIKIVTDEGEAFFPHALVELSGSALQEMNIRGHDNPHIFSVNGIYYAIGEQAVRSGAGAALYGEARYVETYYGVLAAIAMYRAFRQGKRNVYLYGSHTPKDVIYRNDLILAAKGNWDVECCGDRKSFRVVGAAGYDEPTGVYRHATLGDDGDSRRNPALYQGELLVLDIGGFTVSFSVATGGMIDYQASQTRVTGILDVLDEFGKLIRGEYRTKLKGTNTLNPLRLRDALLSGEYDAGGLGKLDVKKLADEACNILMHDIEQFFQEYGGPAAFHHILIGGGGGALMEKRIREHINHPHIVVAEERREAMHMATARGGMKVLRLLDARGKL